MKTVAEPEVTPPPLSAEPCAAVRRHRAATGKHTLSYTIVAREEGTGYRLQGTGESAQTLLARRVRMVVSILLTCVTRFSVGAA